MLESLKESGVLCAVTWRFSYFHSYMCAPCTPLYQAACPVTCSCIFLQHNCRQIESSANVLLLGPTSLFVGNAVIAYSDDVSLCAQMLYTASGRAPSHLYMLLIILLILTQDASFAVNVHKVQLTSVPWYKERLLNRTSLGAPFPVVAALIHGLRQRGIFAACLFNKLRLTLCIFLSLLQVTSMCSPQASILPAYLFY